MDTSYSQKLENLSQSGMKDNATTEIIGKWTIQSIQTGEWNKTRYSKSWHRKHGGVFEVDSRGLIFTKKHGRGVIKKEIEINSWAGDFIARSVIEAGLAPKKSKYNLKIRLNKAFDASFMYSKRGYKFYSRTILGEHVDYVIESPLGMIYHDQDKSKLISGVHEKIRQAARKLKGIVNWNKCKKLGFCDSGIKEFCDAFGFDKRGEYTLPEIEAAVREKPGMAAPFLSELNTLALAFNYSVHEFN